MIFLELNSFFVLFLNSKRADGLVGLEYSSLFNDSWHDEDTPLYIHKNKLTFLVRTTMQRILIPTYGTLIKSRLA